MGDRSPVIATAFTLMLALPADHSAFDALLRAHVTEEGLVDCDAFARSAEFRSYLGRLEAQRLEEQLEDQARAFLLRSPAKNRLDAATRTVFAGPILVWYRDDFGGTSETLGRFLARYRPEGPEKELLLSGRFRVVETDYDWTLNSVGKGRALK
jgi:hypothetical protein